MIGFDTIIVVDWSAASQPTPARPSADAIWIGYAGKRSESEYFRTRHAAMERVADLCRQAIDADERILACFDFPFGYPAGFAKALTGRPDALALWDEIARRVEDTEENANNRFDVAAEMNRRFPGTGPFWGRPRTTDLPDLPEKGTMRAGHGQNERREIETLIKRAQPVWKLYTTGSVGSQALTGIARLARLRQALGDQVSVWPFESTETPVVLAEIYPSLLDDAVRAELAENDAIKDEVQVSKLAQHLYDLQRAGAIFSAMSVPRGAAKREEGWILGVDHMGRTIRPPDEPLAPPRLKNDCFALPPGVDWTPVDEALTRLQDRLHPVVGTETIPLAEAKGRVLSQDAMARRSNPPAANSAVDGYGFAHAATSAGDNALPLVAGRAAAGAPASGAVPVGSAIRILTGALLPEGVDTVVLEEDTATDGTRIAFEGPIKPGANTRRAGEDVMEGEPALTAGTRLGPPEIAILAATGVTEVPVYRRLRVGVLSTGDEIVESGATPSPDKTYDANRPMLLSLFADWALEPVDLGHVADNRDALRRTLDDAASRVDAIFTSGGASAGDEDHVSALLGETGSRADWRIALKPGRPLALGVWKGRPVFGLPGNPVAALVCTMIFGRPALGLLGGEGWHSPTGVTVPAAFEKKKKPGRREYLRARLTPEGHAEVFKSEGSGRISGLAWATGLVELQDGPANIVAGDPVRFIPYHAFR